MLLDQIRQEVFTLPEVRGWPEIQSLLDRALQRRSAGSEYVFAGSLAVGGTEEQALPGALAIRWMHLSIVLVDDMLDQDTKGEYLTLGPAKTANLALALQALSHRVMETSDIDTERRLALHRHLDSIALRTAFGQSLGEGAVSNEETYWQAVEAKSTPLPSSAIYLGALLGGSSFQIAEKMAEYGALLGKAVQINDDIADALQTPAAPDWKRQYNNLAILFALTVPYDQRAAFVELLPHTDEPNSLQKAQEILVECGALSYCAFKLLEVSKSARQLTQTIPLPNPMPLQALLDKEIEPIRQIFLSLNLPIPEGL